MISIYIYMYIHPLLSVTGLYNTTYSKALLIRYVAKATLQSVRSELTAECSAAKASAQRAWRGGRGTHEGTHGLYRVITYIYIYGYIIIYQIPSWNDSQFANWNMAIEIVILPIKKNVIFHINGRSDLDPIDGGTLVPYSISVFQAIFKGIIP